MRGESLCSTSVRITVSGDAVRRTPGYRKTAEHDHGCADADPLDAKTTEWYYARRRQHHDPDKRSSRDPLVESGRDSEINDQPGDTEAGHHEVVDPLHVLPQPNIDVDSLRTPVSRAGQRLPIPVGSYIMISP
jgi:hypothetical protein